MMFVVTVNYTVAERRELKYLVMVMERVRRRRGGGALRPALSSLSGDRKGEKMI